VQPALQRSFGWLWLLPAVVISGALLGLQGLPDHVPGLERIRHAGPVVFASPSGARESFAVVTALPNRLDGQLKGEPGTATYGIVLPHFGKGDIAIFFPRVGNQVEFRLNGKWAGEIGRRGNGRFDAAKSPTLVPLPSELLGPSENLLEVTVHAQAGRWSGISDALIGPVEDVGPLFRQHLAMRTGAAMTFFVSMLVMGALALGLWRYDRQALYLCFAAAAITGAIPNLDRVMDEVPINGVVWMSVVNVSRAWHIALMCCFLLLVSGVSDKKPWRALIGYLPLALVLVLLHQTSGNSTYWKLCLGLLVPIGIYSVWHVARRVHLVNGHGTAWPMLASGLVATVAALHDYGGVLLSLSNETHFAILPHAMFLMVIAMGWVIIERYARALREHQDLASSLEDRVREREARLHESLSALRVVERDQAVLSERQRIMRDIHDGVGAQLVGLINLIGQGPSAGPLREHAQAAMDELRIAVDALQTTGDDLATVLGTARYRLQQRFDAAGIEFEWHMELTSSKTSRAPSEAMHVQRVLHEALTNVLKHAGAKRVRVEIREVNALTTITVDDDGIGLNSFGVRSECHGLRNMRSRAESLGGRLNVERSPWAGTRVRLELPS
jgi:signal transduction histidine kinase